MRVPAYRLHSSGQARVTINGKAFYLGEYDSPESKNEYARIIAEYLSCDHKPAFNAKQESLLIIELIASYSEFAKKYYGPGQNSEAYRIGIILRALGKLYGHTRAIDFGPKALKAVRQYLLDGNVDYLKLNETKKKKKQPPRSRKYINSLVKRLVAMFKWAAGEELLPPTVYQALMCVPSLKANRTTARETDEIEPVPDAVVEATLPHLPPVVADMVRFQSLVGCRPGEVCAIKPCMVDRSSDVWEIKLKEHKTAWRNKKRIIYVGPQAQKILLPYLTDRTDEDYCFRPIDSERRRRTRNVPESCGNRKGKSNTPRETTRKLKDHYTTGSYGNAIRRACREFEIEHWAPNQLRHSVGTKVRKEGDIEAASAVLGHSNIVTTQIYAKANREKAIEAVKRLG